MTEGECGTKEKHSFHYDSAIHSRASSSLPPLRMTRADVVETRRATAPAVGSRGLPWVRHLAAQSLSRLRRQLPLHRGAFLYVTLLSHATQPCKHYLLPVNGFHHKPPLSKGGGFCEAKDGGIVFCCTNPSGVVFALPEHRALGAALCRHTKKQGTVKGPP